MKKKLMSLLLAASMILSCLPILASAGGNPVQIVETGNLYATVQNAVNAATNGQTIKLNTACTENVTIPTGKSVTIDLNGNDLAGTGDGSVITVSSGASLTLTDNSAGKTGKITGGKGSDIYGEYLGGGVYVAAGGTFVMNGGTITGCEATKGGGVFSWGSFTMNGSSAIVNCKATVDGGGVCACNCSFTMNDSSKVSNCSADNGGGGVYTWAASGETASFIMNGNSTISDCESTVENSKVNRRYGGGVCVENSIFTMNGGTITGNNAANNNTGGGVYVYRGTFTMNSGSITDNTANTYAGGVYVDSNATFNMTGGSVISNNNGQQGAGVYSKGTFTMFGSSEITGNTGTNGGGVGIGGGAFTMFENSKISFNTGSGVGGVYIQTGAFKMTGGSINHNTGTNMGGVVVASNDTITLGGKAKITDNVKGGTISGGVLTGGTANNFYLLNSKYITLDTNTKSTDSFKVGVTTQTTPTETAPVKITTNGTADDAKYFTSDNADYEVKFNTDHLELAVKSTPSHTHTFTYTANDGKLTATCTQGCDKGYDTTPLTLTLTAPTSLAYDGNAKVFTFADGEAAAWTGAGLELPTIYYYEKKDYPFYMGIDSAPTDAGGDYMVEITVNKKAARIYFTIDKAIPYIKTNPKPTDIIYGKKLADSTLAGGYVQISSSNTTQVGGLFEWKEPDTVPAIADSDVTLYDVIFTPADMNNYNTVSCQVTITVTHTHNPVEVKGKAPTESESGWKDYYECICGEFYEDAVGSVLIPDLEIWKAEGGNGYLAPIPVYSITVSNDGHGTASANPASGTTDTPVTLSATPVEGYEFDRWEVISGGVTVTNDQFAIGIANVEIKAWFKEIIPATYTVTVTNDGHGTASANPASGIAGTTVTLTATPSDSYEFDHWEVISGDITVTNDQFTIGTANAEIKAHFKAIVLPTPVLTTISVSKAPDKATYTEGEIFDSSGMIITATYSDGSSKTVTGYEIAPSGILAVTDTTVEIRYTENGVTKTVSLVIKVNPAGPVAYKIIIGTNQTIYTDVNSAKFASDADFSKFDHVEVDGWSVPKKYYTAESGSTVITFNRNFIKTLSVGGHTLTIVSKDGSAKTSFNVADPLPKTGDSSTPFLWLGMCTLAIFSILMLRKKAYRD